MEAIVVLPDHLHAVWKLLDDDFNYSLRWHQNVTLGYGPLDLLPGYACFQIPRLYQGNKVSSASGASGRSNSFLLCRSWQEAHISSTFSPSLRSFALFMSLGCTIQRNSTPASVLNLCKIVSLFTSANETKLHEANKKAMLI